MLRSSCLLICFGITQISAAFAAEISWEVDQPFRFLRFQSDHIVHELAYKDAANLSEFSDRRVSAMESLLNDPDWWDAANIETGSSPRSIIEGLRSEEGRTPESFDVRLGWSSLLLNRENAGIYEATCWNATNQSYYLCRSDASSITGGNQYIEPKAHYVSVKVHEADATSVCTLKIETQLNAGYGFLENNNKVQGAERAEITNLCGEAAILRIPYGTTFEISGSADGTVLDNVSVEVTDLVIASIGDSFSSGEGNPDLPALLDDTASIAPRFRPDDRGTELRNFRVPRRKARPDGGFASFSSARWIDRRCHRSMYSAHTRATIALALSGDRHHAITYLTFACSGAEITHGLFWPQDGQECTTQSNGGTRYLQPQISGLVGALGQRPGDGRNLRTFPNNLNSNDRYRDEVLDRVREGYFRIRRANGFCDRWPGNTRINEQPLLRTANFNRKIDLLMVSIGGNDMGFAPLLTSVILRRGLTDTVFGDLMAKFYSIAAGGIGISEANRNILHLSGRFEMLREAIRRKLEIRDPSRVLLTAYPSPAFESSGNFCDSRRKGMNATRLFDLAGPTEFDGRANIAQAQRIMGRLNAKLKSVASAAGYTFVDDFADRFHNHGICAQKSTVDSAAEKMDLPFKTSASGGWNVFHPVGEFFPYAKRQRWFRTFNDSYLNAYHFKENAYEEDPTDSGNAFYHAFRTLGGAVHPSAEGHAAVADSLYCAAAAKLLAGQDSAQCR